MTGTNRRDLLRAVGTGTIGIAPLRDQRGEVLASDRPQSPTTDDATRMSESGPLLFEATPEAGFNYPYFLHVPDALDSNSSERPILVKTTNTGTATDDSSRHQAAARESIETGFSRWLSDELRLPFLVPVFPRPRQEPVDWRHNIHELNTATIHISEGPLERVDLQLISMIEHAKQRLSDYNIRDEVVLNGFSASANFAHRFTALHPDLVSCVAAGGVNGMPILPVGEAKGYTLNYQIGINDVEDLTGKPFDVDEFTDVDFYFYMGSEDSTDTLPAEDVWSEEQRQIARAVYGEDMQDDRFPYAESVYERVGASADFRMYDGVGHRTTDQIRKDVLEFIQASTGVERASETDIIDLIESVGIPVEATLAGSLLTVGGLSYLLYHTEGD